MNKDKFNGTEDAAKKAFSDALANFAKTGDDSVLRVLMKAGIPSAENIRATALDIALANFAKTGDGAVLRVLFEAGTKPSQAAGKPPNMKK